MKKKTPKKSPHKNSFSSSITIFGVSSVIFLVVVAGFYHLKKNFFHRPTSLGIETHTPEQPTYTFNNDELFTYVDPTLIQPEGGTVSMLATGDVLLARSINSRMRRTNDFNWPFANMSNFLKRADLSLINLETPLVQDCPTKEDGMIFCGDTRGAASLTAAGIDVVNIANNHMENYGQLGVQQTMQSLQGNSLPYTGVSRPVIKTVGNQKFGFLGFDDVDKVTNWIDRADDQKVIDQIKNLKPKVDILIVSFHWGEEYRSTPTARQKALAHLAIDAGADVLIGNHPHWVQAVEQYNGKWISYSHGNFIFDQMWSRETQEGVVGWYVFNHNGLIDVKFLPVILDQGQPRFATEKEAQPILLRMKEASAPAAF